MTLKDQLQQTLLKMPLFSAGDETVAVGETSGQLRCRLVALDSLACAFTRLSLAASSLSAMSVDELKQTAERLSSRLTYLLEPISPIEIDAHGCVVQLRSHPPQKDTDGTSYYELLVSRAGEISLCRYARASGQVRQIIPAHVTREVLCRLAADFVAVAS